MNFVNLTPHVINIYDDSGNTLLHTIESSNIVRCAVKSVLVGTFDDVSLYSTSYGDVIDMPEPQLNTMYIVSMPVRLALPDRDDIASPGDLIRNEAGLPIGCKGLNIN